jgi:hypothetical protein
MRRPRTSSPGPPRLSGSSATTPLAKLVPRDTNSRPHSGGPIELLGQRHEPCCGAAVFTPGWPRRREGLAPPRSSFCRDGLNPADLDHVPHPQSPIHLQGQDSHLAGCIRPIGSAYGDKLFTATMERHHPWQATMIGQVHDIGRVVFTHREQSPCSWWLEDRWRLQHPPSPPSPRSTRSQRKRRPSAPESGSPRFCERSCETAFTVSWLAKLRLHPAHPTFRSHPQRPAQKFRRDLPRRGAKGFKFWNTGMWHIPPLRRNGKKLERFGNARQLCCPRSEHAASRASMNGMKAFEALANRTMLYVRKLYRRDQETRRSRMTWRC